ncbi:MAG TPA: NTP transferase domain-containing protein, partial [Erythrobacter sp.]|nr:NTP transferase domain-containing protein [Erythrobacter sp.]
MTTPSAGWTALVLAGQRPGVDPVAAHFGLHAKALIPVAGEPMLSRVLRALTDTPEIARIIVLAQNAEALLADPALAWTAGDDRIEARVSGSTISGSVLAAISDPAIGLPVLVTTADNVMLTPATVAEFVAGAGSSDVSIAFVERTRLEAAVGPNRRTWLAFKD